MSNQLGNVILLVASPQEQSLRISISKYQLEGNVFLVGPKPHSQICDWINISDIFVVPSRIESASVTLLEALACGRPVVATRVGIVPTVLNSKCGIMVKTNDSRELSRGIEEALKKDWNLNEITRRVKNFSWENSVKQLVDIYDTLIK